MPRRQERAGHRLPTPFGGDEARLCQGFGGRQVPPLLPPGLPGLSPLRRDPMGQERGGAAADWVRGRGAGAVTGEEARAEQADSPQTLGSSVARQGWPEPLAPVLCCWSILALAHSAAHRGQVWLCPGSDSGTVGPGLISPSSAGPDRAPTLQPSPGAEQEGPLSSGSWTAVPASPPPSPSPALFCRAGGWSLETTAAPGPRGWRGRETLPCSGRPAFGSGDRGTTQVGVL